MASLTAIFGNAGSKVEDTGNESEKLLNLYWNRAELKKEFAELRAEQFRLQDLVKQKDGAAARLQQKLDHLENLLLDPEWVYNVVAHFQLRGLNLRCQAKLAKFAEELKQKREQKQHGRLLAAWHADQDRKAAAVEQEINEGRLAVQMLEDRLQAERHRLATMSAFVKLFRGRSLMASLDRIAAEIEAGQLQERELLRQLEALQNEQPPDTQGLDIATKRMINFMILAFAQHLFLHFESGDLVRLAKEAGDKSAGAVNYGGKQAADEIVRNIRKRLDGLQSATAFADVLRRRSRLIAEKAVFRSDDDAVPVSSSVATVFEFDAKDGVSRHDANLLGENYWELEFILSR